MSESDWPVFEALKELTLPGVLLTVGWVALCTIAAAPLVILFMAMGQ